MNLLVTPMSGKKHIFKMVPGREVPNDQINHKLWFRQNAPIKKVELVPLDDKNDIALDLLPVTFCSGNLCQGYFSCVEEENERSVTIHLREYDSNLDHINNKHVFVYYGNDTLAKLSMTAIDTVPKAQAVYSCSTTTEPKQLEYEYVTWEDSDTGNSKYYFSDREGNIIDSPDNEALQDIISYYCKKYIKDIPLSSIQKSTLLSNAFAKIFAENLTENQLKTLANTLSNEQLQVLAQNLTDKQLQKIIPELNSNQLQALAENLTDEQLRALVDHLTNHQLQTLAQELNPEKLQIIVPILNDAQLEALVRDLNPEQVKEILPHLKTDQFKALIKTLSDEQFTVLAKDLAEHHLTILSKELEGDQLKALVNSLQEDQLKDLVNKLDHEKLEAIAQDLTDSNRIQIIIKSLANNPEKLQAFARNMSNEQFKELLDNVGAEELKDIIHKLPYEKVTAVIGDLSNQDQSKAIIDALKETLEKQSELINGMREELKEFITPPPMDSSHIIEEYYGFGLV